MSIELTFLKARNFVTNRSIFLLHFPTHSYAHTRTLNTLCNHKKIIKDASRRWKCMYTKEYKNKSCDLICVRFMKYFWKQSKWILELNLLFILDSGFHLIRFLYVRIKTKHTNKQTNRPEKINKNKASYVQWSDEEYNQNKIKPEIKKRRIIFLW